MPPDGRRECTHGVVLGFDQVELLNRQRWRTNLELALAMADYIEHFYNPSRRHSALGYLPPNELEDLNSLQPQAKLPYVVVHLLGYIPLSGGDGIRTHGLYIANVVFSAC
jgi:hypothetical protein